MSTLLSNSGSVKTIIWKKRKWRGLKGDLEEQFQYKSYLHQDDAKHISIKHLLHKAGEFCCQGYRPFHVLCRVENLTTFLQNWVNVNYYEMLNIR